MLRHRSAVGTVGQCRDSGFYNATEIGYASALFARHRGETDPIWISAMRLDSRDTAKKAFRYFDDCDQTGQPILFDAESIPSSSCDPSRLAEWFRGTEPTFALASAYALIKQGVPPTSVVEAAMQIASAPKAAKHRELAPLAIRLLGQSRIATNDVRQLIEKLISQKDHALSIAALKSADTLGMRWCLSKSELPNY